MEWFLIILLLTDGQWALGNAEEGWSSEQPSKEICLEKRDEGNASNDPNVLKFGCIGVDEETGAIVELFPDD